MPWKCLSNLLSTLETQKPTENQTKRERMEDAYKEMPNTCWTPKKAR